MLKFVVKSKNPRKKSTVKLNLHGCFPRQICRIVDHMSDPKFVHDSQILVKANKRVVIGNYKQLRYSPKSKIPFSSKKRSVSVTALLDVKMKNVRVWGVRVVGLEQVKSFKIYLTKAGNKAKETQYTKVNTFTHSLFNKMFCKIY